MNLEERNDVSDINQFIGRGVSLAEQGRAALQSNQSPFLARYSYEAYQITIAGQNLTLIREKTHGSFDEGTFDWRPRHQVVVKFTPNGQANLRLKKGIEEGIATFQAFREEDEVSGTLYFDRGLIERAAWWDRLVDSLNGSMQVVDTMEFNRGARLMLRNLNNLMVNEPTEIIPVNPDKWRDIVASHYYGFSPA